MATKKTEKVQDETVKAEHTFSKEQILSSKRFRHRRDMLTAILDDGEQYTLADVDELIEKYMKGKVK